MQESEEDRLKRVCGVRSVTVEYALVEICKKLHGDVKRGRKANTLTNMNKCQNLQHALLLKTSSDNSSMLTLDLSVAFEQPQDKALGLLLIGLVLLFITEKLKFYSECIKCPIRGIRQYIYGRKWSEKVVSVCQNNSNLIWPY